jgi:RNA polymerase sigma-70 factor (ECF subfamily)
MEINGQTLDNFRLKLRCKVRYHVGGACPDVEDLVQETLVRFLRFAKDERIRNPANIGAFLNGVCNNVILEYRRRLWRDDPGVKEVREEGCAATPAVELMEVREAIEAGLAQLPDRDHAILRALYLEDRSRDEICHALGITDTQFRVVLFRAKDRFRKIYREGLKPWAAGSH